MPSTWLDWQAQEEERARKNPFIDWADFWHREHSEQEWVIDRVLAWGRGHVIYAQKKVGKSLLVLALLLEMLGDRADVIVIYLDWEMTEDDLYERLLEMGHDEDSDLSRLRYWQLPSVGPLDTHQGADQLLEVVDAEREHWPDHHVIVILDTTGRAVRGPENDADTFRAFYRHTGLALKQRGITYARIDHAGKSAEQGQRGSSAKGEDVDIIWRLEPADRGGYTLCRDAARMGWVPEKVGLERLYGPLRFVRSLAMFPEGTNDLVATLERLGVPADATNRAARKALKEAEETASNNVLAAALRYRKSKFARSEKTAERSDDALDGTTSTESRNTPNNNGERATEHDGTESAVDAEHTPPLCNRGGGFAHRSEDHLEEPDFPDWAYTEDPPFDPAQEPPE